MKLFYINIFSNPSVEQLKANKKRELSKAIFVNLRHLYVTIVQRKITMVIML